MSMTKMGRPTKYRKSFIKEAEKYLQDCKNARKVPFLEEFAVRIGVSEDSVQRWVKAKEEFCGAVERIKDRQCMELKLMGLKYPSVLIFLLEADHGMVRAGRIQHEGSVSKPLNIIFTDSATWKRAKENQT